jgi:hypothetical protein
MSLRQDAEKLLKQLKQTEFLLWRMKQNRVYDARHQEEVDQLYEKVHRQELVIPGVVERIENLELVDPLGISRPNEQQDCSILVTGHQKSFVREVEEPLAEFLQNVEGPAAKARWLPDPSKPRAFPVLEVRKRWATLVGISDYGQTGWESLSTPSADAKAIHDLLLSDQRYGSQPDQTRMLTDSAAQRNAILNAIESTGQAASSDDMLLFYFSGHGDLQDGDAILIPYDYDHAAPKDSAVRIAEVTELMHSSRAHVKIIILDACHSGPDIPLGTEGKKGIAEEIGMDPEFERRVFEQARGAALLASCVAKQVSWTYKKKSLSAFTYFLCEGMRGAADFDRKGFVTVSDEFHYVANEVQRWAEESNRKQTPALSYTTTGEIILMDNRHGKTP